MNDFQSVFKDSEIFNTRFEYAWKYFNFHATQRTTMFSFFLVFSGISINACVLLLNSEKYILLGLSSLMGIVMSIMFIFLERRNEELVHISEDILRTIEKEVLFKNSKHQIEWPKRRSLWGRMIEFKEKEVPIGIFIRQDYDKENCGESRNLHGTWLPWIEIMMGFMYLTFFVYAIWKYVTLILKPSSM